MSEPLAPLRDRAVLITDGTSLLSPGLTEAFGASGARLYTVFPDGAAPPMGGRTSLVGDLSHDSGVRALLEAVARHESGLEAVLVPLALSGPLEAAAEEAFLPIALLKQSLAVFSAPPRYLIPILYAEHDSSARVGAALCRTLVRYAAGHVAGQDLRLNLVRAEGQPSPELANRAARAALALASGWLDAVRGQELVIGDR